VMSDERYTSFFILSAKIKIKNKNRYELNQKHLLESL